MIKLKQIILNETADSRAMRDSKDGASKIFVRDFKKTFENRSKELGYGKVGVKVKSYNVQVSKPAGFDKAIKYEKMKGLEIDYQFPKDYDLNTFIKDMKKGFSGYKVEKTRVKTHFYLHKGGNVYYLAYTPSIAGTYVMGSSRV
jgi:hypothetical protein